MELIFSILLSLLIAGVIPSLVVMCVNFPDYKHYTKVYKQIQTASFYRNGHQVYTVKHPQYPDFVWFIHKGSFILEDNCCLHSGFPFVLDPYAEYWRWKFNRFLKHKLKVGLIQNY